GGLVDVISRGWLVGVDPFRRCVVRDSVDEVDLPFLDVYEPMVKSARGMSPPPRKIRRRSGTL
ncbi:MAG TPA: hypothetical protein VHC49_11220, partial [Mycobacteriales bacterium]|nr:hypothetical protein [Mycobacteriales bacterium]